MNEDAEREKEWWLRRSLEPEQQVEWLRQLNVIYGGLIVIGIYMVQPFLTAASLDTSAKICVIAFSVAIPVLSALVLVNLQETFRRRSTTSVFVGFGKMVGQLGAFVGVVAGFWHILWIAGVGTLVGGLLGLGLHSAGYYRLEAPGSGDAPTS